MVGLALIGRSVGSGMGHATGFACQRCCTTGQISFTLDSLAQTERHSPINLLRVGGAGMFLLSVVGHLLLMSVATASTIAAAITFLLLCRCRRCSRHLRDTSWCG